VSKHLLVIGGSQQGRQAIDVVEERGTEEVVGVLDRALPAGSEVAGYPVLGRDDELLARAEASDAEGFLVAVGDNFSRGRILTWAMASCPGLEPVSAVHPSAVIAHDAAVGPGAIIMAGAIVSSDCVLGAGVVLGTKASVDHDDELGDFVSLAPNATMGGVVRVGDYTAVGLGANVIHGVTIGAHSVIGAGAVVLSDVPDHVVAFGVPARVQRRREEGEDYLGSAHR
jgi:sugar O-acyltransferase (sialic acid O-acetyltransferase NeuD family)